MAEKKKLFIIVSVLKDGGAQRAAGNIAMALQDRYDVSFVTFRADDAAYPHGGTLYDLHLPRKRGPVVGTINDIRRANALRKLKKRLRPDVSVSFLEDANLANALSRGIGATVVSLRTHMTSRPMGRLAKCKAWYAYSRANAVVAVSRAAAEDMQRRGWARKCVAIENMVDGRALMERALASGNTALPEGEPIIASMGSLVAQKGMWNLIRAFRSVLPEYPNARLMLLGGGDPKPYEALAKDLGIAEHVSILGFCKEPHALLARADLFVLPSRYEGMPNALLEAMAVGLPVISADCQSGPREILAPDTELSHRAADIEYAPYGVLTPVCEGGFLDADAPETYGEAALSRAMLTLLGDEPQRKAYAEKAKTRAKDFSPLLIRQKWEALIEEQAGGKK